MKIHVFVKCYTIYDELSLIGYATLRIARNVMKKPSQLTQHCDICKVTQTMTRCVGASSNCAIFTKIFFVYIARLPCFSESCLGRMSWIVIELIRR